MTIVKPMFITFKKRVYEESKEFMIGFGHGKRPGSTGKISRTFLLNLPQS